MFAEFIWEPALTGVVETCFVIAVELWPATPIKRSLTAESVHVWRVALQQTPAALCCWRLLLTPAERGRIDSFRNAGAAERKIVGWAARRELLRHYLGCDPRALTFEQEPNGRPRLVDATRISFSTSYSDRWVVLAFAFERDLGVDVEMLRKIEFEALAGSYFSTLERAAWRAVPPESSVEMFYRIWTRKEAYLKALGTGLSRPLPSFSVRMTGEGESLLAGPEPEASSSPWIGYTFFPDAHNVASLVTAGTPGTIELGELSAPAR